MAKKKKIAKTKKNKPPITIGSAFIELRSRWRGYRTERAKIPRYKSFRLQKKITLLQEPLPTSWVLLKNTVRFLWQNKGLFTGITIVYALFYYIFVRANTIPSVNIKALQNVVNETFGNAGTAVKTATLFGAVLGSSRTTGTGSTMSSILVILVSLVYVWSARERMNNIQIKVRDALYQSLSPLLSVGAVLVVMSIQLIPFALATYFYTSARANSLFVSGFEDLAFFTLTALAGLLSFYYVSATIMALYVATIPGMYPIIAIRSATKLVKFRRLAVFRRIMALPLALSALYLVLLLLVLRFVPSITYPFIDVYTVLVVPVANIYLYKLYRSLL